ncbi:oocyte-secreted protein 2 [Acomys russatus]|uniref:oocyte-secreted protein 2 n=1 Tax=Acomys russatus TaxID=60746 RepID=UPI0021E1E4C4|nr:oocyte-secreted protein 2 [Acomys russatus]
MALEVLALLAALVCACAWNIDVSTHCSLDWMMVFVSSASKNRTNPYIFADELVLGKGCPATRIHTYQYDFIYPVFHCGIRTKIISEETISFETEMHFTPRNVDCESQMVPLQCFASRKSVWLVPVSPDEDLRVDESPFMTDFEATPEELGLLTSHHPASSPNRES